MENSPLDHGLSLTLSWGAAGARVRRSFPLGALLRVGLGLALCAGCYEAGRWHGALEAQSEKSAGAAAVAVRAVKAVPAAETRTGASGLASGQAVNEAPDLITPLNVRDPSALVMGPAFNSAPPPSAAQPQSDEPPSAPQARVFPRPSTKVKPDPRF